MLIRIIRVILEYLKQFNSIRRKNSGSLKKITDKLCLQIIYL